MIQKCSVICLIVAVILFGSASVNSEVPHMSHLSYIKPIHYDLYLAYHLEEKYQFPFFGLVQLQFTPTILTSHLVLDAENLTLQEDSIVIEKMKKNNIPFEMKDLVWSKNHDFFIVTTSNAMYPESLYEITIPFRGYLTTNPKGVYVRSISKTENYVLLTNFLPNYARKAFPCIDQPQFKTTFNIRIAHDKSLAAISNMHLERQTNEYLFGTFWPVHSVSKAFKVDSNLFFETWVWDVYAKSYPISTSMLAYAVTGFSFGDSVQGKSTPTIRFWARNDTVKTLGYAQTVTGKLLKYYENVFLVNYRQKKLDIIVIPGLDFDSGVRSLGFISIGENDLKIYPEQKTEESKETATKTIAYSLAHMWLGNVSVDYSWKDYWLLNGFARYFSIKGKNAVNSKWNNPDVDAAELFYPVYVSENLKCNPWTEIISNSTMDDKLDDVMFSRGAVLFHMLNKVFGDEVFEKGVSTYFVKYSKNISSTSELWKELTKAALFKWVLPSPKVSVNKIMESWTKYCSSTVINVTRNYLHDKFEVDQDRFVVSRYQHFGKKIERWVPLTIYNNKVNTFYKRKHVWLEPFGNDSAPQFETTALPTTWILLNPTMTAPVRILYDSQNLHYLIFTLLSDFQTISVSGRVQLIHDSVTLAAASMLKYDVTFSLLTYLKHETNYAPMKTGLKLLTNFGRRLFREPRFHIYLKYMQGIVGQAFKQIGGFDERNPSKRESDNLENIRMRVLVGHYACFFDVPECDAEAAEKFAQWMKSEKTYTKNTIPYDFRQIVYCSAVKTGSSKEWYFLHGRRSEAFRLDGKILYSETLACSRDHWILDQYLESAVNGSLDFPWMAILAMSKHSHSYEKVVQLLYRGIGRVKKGLRRVPDHMRLVIEELLKHFTEEHELNMFLKWQARNGDIVDINDRRVSKAIARVKLTISWLHAKKRSAVASLEKYAGKKIIVTGVPHSYVNNY